MKRTILLTLMLLFSISKSFSCSCIGTNEPLSKKIEKAYSESDIVVTGKILNESTERTGLYVSSSDIVTYTIELTEIIKGSIKSAIIEIKSYRGSDYCGYIFEIDQEYLIYSYKKDKGNFTDLCTRTNKISKLNKKELKLLNEINYKDKE